MDKLRNINVPILPVVILAIVAVGLAVYFAFVRPAQSEAKIAREWATPEAAAARGPGRQAPAGYQQAVQNLLQKEGRSTRMPTRRERE